MFLGELYRRPDGRPSTIIRTTQQSHTSGSNVPPVFAFIFDQQGSL